jgi:tRNA1(Val) A37 N6-methylase TrmN6
VPGPIPEAEAPSGAGREALWPREEEDLCWLAGHWRILQRRDGHRFSLDDLVTAEMAARLHAAGGSSRRGAEERARFLDLGCGIGTVLLFLAWRFPEAEVTGIEAQPLSAGLARRSIAWNGVTGRCSVVDGDLRDLSGRGTPGGNAAPALLPDGARFDLITGTPPYFARGGGTESDRVQRAPCRFEHRGGLADYCVAAARRLADTGVFVACAAAGQFAEVEPAAAAAGLAVERWQEIVPRAGKLPLLATFSLRPAGRVARRIDEPALTVRDVAGQWTREFLRVRAAMGMPPPP